MKIHLKNRNSEIQNSGKPFKIEVLLILSSIDCTKHSFFTIHFGSKAQRVLMNKAVNFLKGSQQLNINHRR